MQRYIDSDIGVMLTQQMANRVDPRWPYWAADNGCFSDKWDEQKWWQWLQELPTDGCLFAVCPDVVGDFEATLKLFHQWHNRIAHFDFQVAFVAQNGWDETRVPWDYFNWLFIGGDDAFKLSAGPIIADAKRRGKLVHVGRVNSYDRLRWAWYYGADTADGTYVGFGPDVNLPKVEGWLARLSRLSAGARL